MLSGLIDVIPDIAQPQKSNSPVQFFRTGMRRPDKSLKAVNQQLIDA